MKIGPLRLRTGLGLGRKGYNATLNSMKAYRFPREQFAILSGETRRGLITICATWSQGKKREFIDWYSAKPFEIVQIDLKQIRDHKALTKEQIIHLDRYGIPNCQWSALDVNSRFKLIAYSREKSWTNRLCWYLWVISWLRSHRVQSTIVFTVDNGEEFGGKSWMKVRELRELIDGFGCRVIQNHKGHCE